MNFTTSAASSCQSGESLRSSPHSKTLTRRTPIQASDPRPKGLEALVFLLISFACCVSCRAQSRGFEQITRLNAAEAHQGIGVDEDFFYAIGTKTIGKYDKRTGAKIKQWKPTAATPIVHLDSGVVVDRKLYCAHSNYPYTPMTGSVEIWNTTQLEHVGRHVFKNPPGSCTWVDRHDGFWWVCFAHYNGIGGLPGKDNTSTIVVKYNSNWNELKRWMFPRKVLERFAPYSCSGGSWGPDGFLYCSGHDRPELYVMRAPPGGGELELIDIVSIESLGQGVAWDRSNASNIYAIRRKAKEVVVSRFGRNE